VGVPAPLVYQVHVRPWLHRLSRELARPATLADLPLEALDAWARNGVTHVWLLGVWPIGAQARQHAVHLAQTGKLPAHSSNDPVDEVCGSPYAVAAYHADAALGGDKALDRLRTALRSRGIGLILDFVPNHLALDHPWVHEHPEWFVGSASRREETFRAGSGARLRWIAHGKDPFFPAWADTAQLDWRLQAVHEAMLRELSAVAERCDGIRADMAMLLLPEVFEKQWEAWPAAPGGRAKGSFWSHAIAAIKGRHPQFLTLAEAYWDLEPTLLDQGFDYAYDKRFYDHLIARRPADLRTHLSRSTAGLWSRGARFLENHDEVRVASLASQMEHRSWAALLLALPGLRLVHEGQWDGLRGRADIRTLRRQVEPIDGSLRQSYHFLSRSVRELGDWVGVPQLLAPQPAWPGNPSHDGFVGWIGRRGAGSPFLVVANLANHEGQCVFRLPEAFGDAAPAWVDLLSGQEYSTGCGESGGRVLSLAFAPHRCAWFVPGKTG
jgi:hypothetical protein